MNSSTEVSPLKPHNRKKTDFSPNSNLPRIIRTILRLNHPTRIALSHALNLSQSAVTKLINRLMDFDLVHESSCLDTDRGRKPIELTVNTGKLAALSIRINRNYISALICTLDGSVLYKFTEPISAENGIKTGIQKLKTLIHKILSHPPLPINGIGIALPGPLDIRRKRISMMTGFPGWNEVDLISELTNAFHLPVYLDHDANCGARAEMWYGGHDRNLVYILCDRGIGVGLVLGSELYSNPRGFSGELGHTSINCFGPKCECGNNGCLELYASTIALEHAYQRELFKAGHDCNSCQADEICTLVRQGNETAQRAFAQISRYLAFGTVSLINLLNPESVIFDDPITEGGPYFLKIVKETLQQYLLPDIYNDLQVSVSTLNGNAVLLGAGALVFEQLLEAPHQI